MSTKADRKATDQAIVYELASDIRGWTSLMTGESNQRWYRSKVEDTGERIGRLVAGTRLGPEAVSALIDGLTRGLAAVRREHHCAYCGNVYVPKRADSRYCSTAHRVAAHRAGRKADPVVGADLAAGLAALTPQQPEPTLRCDECDHEATAAALDTEPLYQCDGCGAVFTGTGSNRCDACGLFAAKVADYACPECESGPMVVA